MLSYGPVYTTGNITFRVRHKFTPTISAAVQRLTHRHVQRLTHCHVQHVNIDTPVFDHLKLRGDTCRGLNPPPPQMGLLEVAFIKITRSHPVPK